MSKKVEQHKSKVVAIRIPLWQAEKLERMAKGRGLTVTEWFRPMLDDRVKPDKPRQGVSIKPEDAK